MQRFITRHEIRFGDLPIEGMAKLHKKQNPSVITAFINVVP